MAEPTNTPLPTAPGTPVAGTPRSGSPVLSHHTLPYHLHHPHHHHHLSGSSLAPPGISASSSHSKPVVLQLGGDTDINTGDEAQYSPLNPSLFADFTAQFDVVHASRSQRSRPEFLSALRDRRWGDFAAVYRPCASDGAEMGVWDEEVWALLPGSLRVVTSAGDGRDLVVDGKGFGGRGVLFCNAALAAAESTADLALVMIISTFRMHLLPSRGSRVGNSSMASPHNPRGHALGLLGLGNTGQKIAQKCRDALGMQILYFDTERRPGHVEARCGARYCGSLRELYAGSDCVVLCSDFPYAAGPGTSKGEVAAIDRESLSCFRPQARFVNLIPRGSMQVDENALADALDSGHIGSAALAEDDNGQGMSYDNDRIRRHADEGRVILMRDNADKTRETQVGYEELGLRNIMAVLNGGEAITPVNRVYYAQPISPVQERRGSAWSAGSLALHR